MPTYDYKCNTCANIQEERMSISKMEDPETKIECKECGKHCTRTYEAVNYAFMTPEALGRRKAPDDFRNFLSQVKKAHPGSAIKDH